MSPEVAPIHRVMGRRGARRPFPLPLHLLSADVENWSSASPLDMSHQSPIPSHVNAIAKSFLGRHKRKLGLGCLVVLFAGLALAVGLAWAGFRGAIYVKNWLLARGPTNIPLSWEQPLGEAALAQIRRQTPFVDDSRLLEALQRLAAPLFNNQTNLGGRFTLFIADSKQINALALPGGSIVFHRGLLERSRSAEEVQGVLAHEMAHVIKRHGVLQLAQSIGLELALQQIQGNENSLRDALLRDSSKLLGLKFSHDHERTADDLAWELLQAAQINPQGMVDFFAAMKAEVDAKGPGGFALGADLLTTHPTPQERLDRLRLKQAAPASGEFKSYEADFKAMQEALRREPALAEQVIGNPGSQQIQKP